MEIKWGPTCVAFSVKLSLWPQQDLTLKVGGAVEAGAGGDGGAMGGGVEGQEQVAELRRRGRNSAVGCISVSKSDG